jgi:hypothetical protein
LILNLLESGFLHEIWLFSATELSMRSVLLGHTQASLAALVKGLRFVGPILRAQHQIAALDQ